MLIVQEENGFRKDLKLMKKRGKNINKLKEIALKLIAKENLPEKNRNHQLTGNYKGFSECHIEPDWLLIYRATAQNLILVRTGTHSDLF
ncbi:MAG: mRNA interferase YafQ [Rickettsiales bacterium]|jgi:mRNA interferase YafQ